MQKNKDYYTKEIELIDKKIEELEQRKKTLKRIETIKKHEFN